MVLLLASTVLHEKRLTASHVADVWSVLGLVSLWTRGIPMSEFKGLRLWRDELPNSDQASYSSDPPYFDNWSVELVRHDGKTVCLQRFLVPEGRLTCPNGEAFLRRLTRVTGLPEIY